MAAHVQERPHLPVPTSPEQHGILAHVGGEEVVGIGDLGLVSQEEPAASEDPLQLLLVDVLGDEHLAFQQPLFGINEFIHVIHPVGLYGSGHSSAV